MLCCIMDESGSLSILPRVGLLGNTAVNWIYILSYFRLDTLTCVRAKREVGGYGLTSSKAIAVSLATER